MSFDVLRHDQKTATAVTHAPSLERRESSGTRYSHQSCYEREQKAARELQRLRDSFGALTLEKDKEIAFLRDQLAAYTSMNKSPVRGGGSVMSLPPTTTHSSVGVQTSDTASPTPTAPPHSITPSIFSVTGKGVVRTARLDRQASLKSARVLATMPREQARGVADRVATALADPVQSLPYLHSIQLGADLVELSAQVCALLESEPRCLSISSPAYVFGDIHGNYTDLRFFADSMWPMGLGLTPGSFLFLGDYVDRGHSSLECVAYLFAQKLLHPKKLFLLRGNHETRAINGLEAHYGSGCFLSQCKSRFGADEGYIVWHQINHAFDRLPLAAVIDNDIFCVHGGVPRPVGNERAVDSILKIPSTALLDVLDSKYYEENAHMSMVSDMLWGDPVSEEREPAMDSSGFGKSLRGGVAVSFGARAIEQFLQRHKFSWIVRAHEAKVDGVAVSKSARVITVFSTSKDHGLGEDAKCGCLLIDLGKIIAINRSPPDSRSLQLQRRRSVGFQSGLRAASPGVALRSARALDCSSAGSAPPLASETRMFSSRSQFVGAGTASDGSFSSREDDAVASAALGVPQRLSSMQESGGRDHSEDSASGSDSTDDEDDLQTPRTGLRSSRVSRRRRVPSSPVASGHPASSSPVSSSSPGIEERGDNSNNQNDDV